MAISIATKVGVARESSWGSGEAPVVMIPVEPPSFSEPFEQILDQLARGVNVLDHGAYQGVGHVEASLSSYFYPEEVGYFILAMLGTVTSTGTAAPYTHTFGLATQPPSLSIQEEGAVYPASATSRRYVGMLPSSLNFSFSSAEGLLTWTCDLTGKRGTAPSSGSIPSDETNPPFLGWHATATINGTSNSRIISAEINISREIDLRYAADGTQWPVRAHSGPIEVTTSMVFDATTSTEMDLVLAHATTDVSFTFSYGSGASAKELTISIPSMNWGEGPVELDRSGISVTFSVSGRAIYNRSTSKLIEITLKNAKQNYLT